MIEKAGTYKARATEVMLGNSRTKGTPVVGVQFVVMDGVSAGQKINWNGYLTEKTAERTIESLQHCGWEGDDLSELAKGLHGINKNEVEIVVEMEAYQGTDADKQGNMYPKVQWVNQPGGRGPKFGGDAMDVSQLANFGKRFKGVAMALKAKRGTTPKPPPVADVDPDDLPF